jgi:TolB-like protein
MVALAGLAVAIAAGGWWRLQRQTASIPIAVLPLTNVSQDPSADYFVDGLTHELIRNLSILDGLVVRSQTSSFAFKGKQQNIRDAGKQLDAEFILKARFFAPANSYGSTRVGRVRDDFPWSGG